MGQHFHFLVLLCTSLFNTSSNSFRGSFLTQMYSVLAPTPVFVFQAFRRTMALSHGDVDEAVLFAKVTENV